MVGPVSTGPFFGLSKLFFAHTTILAVPPADMRVQLSSFKIDAKLAATHVKTSLAGLPDKPHHQAFHIPKAILTMLLALTAQSHTLSSSASID